MSFLSSYKYALGYLVCISIASVLREYMMIQTSPVLILLISSVLACGYFHIINYSQLKLLYSKMLSNKLLFLALNAVVAAMWFATYYSTYFASATIYVYEFFMTGAFLALVFQPNKNTVQRIAPFFFVLLLPAPIIMYKELWLGTLLGIVSGAFGFLYGVVSKKIAVSLEATASQTLAVRFWALIAVTAIFTPSGAYQQLDLKAIALIVLVAFLSFIVQIWLNQKSVIIIGVKESALIASFVPMVTFLLQGITLGDWYGQILILSILGSSYIVYDYIQRSSAWKQN